MMAEVSQGELRVKSELNLKKYLSQVKVKKGMSVIGRTAGIGASVEEIQWDSRLFKPAMGLQLREQQMLSLVLS